MKTKLTLLCILSVALSGCDNSQKKAQSLMENIRNSYTQGQYPQTLLLIDSLRKAYPKEIDLRKEALKIYQDGASQTDASRFRLAVNDRRIREAENRGGKPSQQWHRHSPRAEQRNPNEDETRLHTSPFRCGSGTSEIHPQEAGGRLKSRLILVYINKKT